MGLFENFFNRPCLPIARRSETTRTVNNARILFTVFEDWNEESVVPHISCFISN